jgi:hypothetical protein
MRTSVNGGIDRMNAICRRPGVPIAPKAVQLVVCSWLSVAAPTAYAEGFVDALVRRFAQSDFEFLRAQTNAPFLPLAWLNVTGYQEGEFTRPDGGLTSVTFRQATISQGAFLPLPIGKRNALVIGEWIGNWQDVDTRLDNTGYAWLTFDFRPEHPQRFVEVDAGREPLAAEGSFGG